MCRDKNWSDHKRSHLPSLSIQQNWQVDINFIKL